MMPQRKLQKMSYITQKNFILVRPTNLWNLQIHIKVIYLKGIGNCSGPCQSALLKGTPVPFTKSLPASYFDTRGIKKKLCTIMIS